ncbi:MAG: acetylglutamate kinase [Chloroflexota bacterium]|nr:acetylglutamate kinase [Chloroflexota bacterium]MDE2941743.1 acetylglutamate kinase [Chloroflexota bacterium]MDE3268468.1 acetylglutamate kinase [Chloroflexota bacterium]
MDMTNAPSDSSAHPALVVKIGGSVLGSQDTSLEDLVELQRRGQIPVVVHGGGPVISRWMERQNLTPNFVRGLRVTDAPSMEIVAATLGGLVNKELVSTIHRLGGRALGISGVDGSMLEAEVLDPELGLVGRITRVDPAPILSVLAAGYIPMIAPVAIHAIDGSEWSAALLNINGDTAAGEIARALQAESLVFLTDVEGVMDSEGRVLERLTSAEVQELMQNGAVSGGMVPKVEACLRSLDGVGTARIVDGRRSRALLDLVEGAASGTRIDKGDV